MFGLSPVELLLVGIVVVFLMRPHFRDVLHGHYRQAAAASQRATSARDSRWPQVASYLLVALLGAVVAFMLFEGLN